jgi:hypothetical protein
MVQCLLSPEFNPLLPGAPPKKEKLLGVVSNAHNPRPRIAKTTITKVKIFVKD